MPTSVVHQPVRPASPAPVQTKAVVAVSATPDWVTLWKDAAAALQSSVTFLAVVAGAIWFLRRRQRFPRANVTHEVSHWYVEGSVILHTVVRVQNVGEVVLHLVGISIRAQQLAPTPEEPLLAIRTGRDPVKPGETEILWPSLFERKCDWTKAPREVEPNETEEVHFDVVLPAHVRAVEVYTYIRNHVKRRRDIGWGTNTFCTIGEQEAFVRAPAVATVDVQIESKERIPIMATNREQGSSQDTQKQQSPKTTTSAPAEKRQGPEKTSTSSTSTSSTTDKK